MWQRPLNMLPSSQCSWQFFLEFRLKILFSTFKVFTIQGRERGLPSPCSCPGISLFKECLRVRRLTPLGKEDHTLALRMDPGQQFLSSLVHSAMQPNAWRPTIPFQEQGVNVSPVTARFLQHQEQKASLHSSPETGWSLCSSLMNNYLGQNSHASFKNKPQFLSTGQSIPVLGWRI